MPGLRSMSLLYCCDYFPLVTVSCAPTPPMPKYPTRGVASSAINLSVPMYHVNKRRTTSHHHHGTQQAVAGRRGCSTGQSSQTKRTKTKTRPQTIAWQDRRPCPNHKTADAFRHSRTTNLRRTNTPIDPFPQPPNGRPGGSAAPVPRNLLSRQTPS